MKYLTRLILCVIALTPYGINAYKFIQCDFESDYTCEVMHGIGVFVPPASFITVWFASDK